MSQQLKKSIGLWSAVSIVMGSVIGSGIFMRPASMAQRLGSPKLILLVWLVAGAMSLLGAMIYSELGTMFPETGGPYIYLQKIYGPFVAYLYGWSAMAVINTASLAAITIVCAQYAGFFVHLPRFSHATELSIHLHIPYIGEIYPLEDFGVKALAALILLLLTLINYLSVRFGNAVQVLATVMKTLALVLLISGLLFSGQGHVANFFTDSPDFHPTFMLVVTGFMAATSGAFSSYDGWYNINMVAGELETRAGISAGAYSSALALVWRSISW